MLRWAVRLSSYEYTCVRIKGTAKVWANLLVSWSAPGTVRCIFRVTEIPSSPAEDFEWPIHAALAPSQTAHMIDRPESLQYVDGQWKNQAGAVCIPEDDTYIQLRRCVIAQTGQSGHRGRTYSESTLREAFFWGTLSDVEAF